MSLLDHGPFDFGQVRQRIRLYRKPIEKISNLCYFCPTPKLICPEEIDAIVQVSTHEDAALVDLVLAAEQGKPSVVSFDCII